MDRVRDLGGRAVACITRKTGYNADQQVAGLQVGLGAFILLAALSTPAVWNALTLEPATITPVYAVVTFCVVLQPNLGTASQFILMRAAGAVVGGLCGLLCMYVTYAANGASYQPSATKGAVMVALLSALSLVFSLYRFRYPRYWFAFTVATFSMPMVALNPYHQTYVEYKALFYWWLEVAVGIGAAAAVSTFVFPVTAGHKVRVKTAETLRHLAGLTSATVRYMVTLPLGKNGLAAGVSGRLDGRNAIDTGLSDAFKPLYDTAIAVGANITQTRVLLGVVGTEWNVYSTAHTFPREAYEILLHINRAYLSSIMALLYPLQSGRLALRAVHTMRHEFQDAANLLSSCMLATADCIDQKASYAEALGSLRRVEDRWHELGALCPHIKSSWGENEVLTSDMLVGTLFSLGTRLRRVFFTLPEALHRTQPGARLACARHFHGSRSWDLSQPQEQLRQRARQRAATPTVGGLMKDGLLPSHHVLGLPPTCQQALPPSRPELQPPGGEHHPPHCTQQQQKQQALSSSAEQQQYKAPSPVPSWHLLAPSRLFRKRPSSSAAAETPPPPAVATREMLIWHQLPNQGPANDGGSTDNEDAGLGTPHVGDLQGEALWQAPDAATVAERFPPTLYLPSCPAAGRLAVAVQAVKDRTGFTPEHMALALQLAVAMATACTLHVVQASYDALDHKSIWVVVTVCVVLESAMGGLVLKSGLRIIGTSAAGALGIGCLGLAVLCNGGHYLNDPPKFIAMSAFLPLVLFVLMINHVRFATPYGYAWSVAKFTTPIIALSGYVNESVAWITACWRLANILIGIALDLAASTLVLPITSRCATKHRMQEVVDGLADLAEAVLLQFVEDKDGEGQQPGMPSHQQRRQQVVPASGSGSPSLPCSPAGGSGGSMGGSTLSPGRARQRSKAGRTPLSSAEAAELVVEATSAEAQNKLEEAALGIKHWYSVSAPTHDCSTSLSLGRDSQGAATAEPPLPARDRFNRLFFHHLPTPTAFSATTAPTTFSCGKGSEQLANDGGGGGSAADLELGVVQNGSANDSSSSNAATSPTSKGGTPLAEVVAAPAGGAKSSCPYSQQHQQLARHAPGSQPGSPLAVVRCTPPEPSPLELNGPAVAAVGVFQPSPPPPSLGRSRVVMSLPARPTMASSSGFTEAPPLSQQRQPLLSPGSALSLRSVCRQVPMPPELPTVVSQQAFITDELPSLPPLHIPLHHQLTIAEEIAAAAAAAQQKQPGSAGSRSAAAYTGSGPLDSPLGAGGGQAQPRRTLSSSSTVFYAGTPRDRRLRHRRSQWLRERALGKSFIAVHALGAELAATIAHMHELALFARFEFFPCLASHRVVPQDILAAQHACRKLLNVLLSIPYLADAPDVPHDKLLLPHPREVRGVAEQMGEALRALGLVVEGEMAIDRALEMVFNLQLQVQMLLLEVEQEGPSANATQTDAVLGVAALGIMFSATQTVQLLYRCVLRLLGTPNQHAAAEEAFAQSAAWGASVEAILVARGVVLTSLATDGDEGGSTAQMEADAEAVAMGMGRGD